MDEMEAKMGAILGNPEMMQKIMAMAQSLNQSAPPKQESAPAQTADVPTQSRQEAPGFSLPELDPSILQKLSGFARQNGIDSNQKTLLKALSPYLSRERITKLEKAMRAAKMAAMASSFLTKSGLLSGIGR